MVHSCLQLRINMQLLELMFQNCLCHAAQCINCFVYTCARVFGCYAQYASLVVWHMFLQLCSCNAFRLFLMHVLSQAGSDKPVQNKGVMLAHSAHHSEASHCKKGNKIGRIRTSSWIKWSADMWISCQWAWAEKLQCASRRACITKPWHAVLFGVTALLCFQPRCATHMRT